MSTTTLHFDRVTFYTLFTDVLLHLKERINYLFSITSG